MAGETHKRYPQMQNAGRGWHPGGGLADAPAQRH